MLRHPAIRERDLLGLESARHHPHLAGIVAEDVVHVLEPLDRVVGHGGTLNGLPRGWKQRFRNHL
jgi:hypothetical protein